MSTFERSKKTDNYIDRIWNLPDDKLMAEIRKIVGDEALDEALKKYECKKDDPAFFLGLFLNEIAKYHDEMQQTHGQTI